MFSCNFFREDPGAKITELCRSSWNVHYSLGSNVACYDALEQSPDLETPGKPILVGVVAYIPSVGIPLVLIRHWRDADSW